MTSTCKGIKNYSDTFYSLQPLYNILKLFALDWTIRRDAFLETRWSLRRAVLTIFFLAFLTSLTLYLKITYFYSDLDTSITITDVCESIYDFLQYLVDIYFVYKYGRSCKLEYYKYYKHIDAVLDFKNYSSVRKEVNCLLASFIILWVCSNSLDFVGWLLSYGWVRPLVFSIAYVFIATKMLTFLDLTANVINLEYRLIAMSNILEKYYIRNGCRGSLLIDDPITNLNWIHFKKNKNFHFLSTNNEEENYWRNDTRWLSKCYLLLAEQSEFINKIFGPRILLSSISLLIDMIRFINIAVRISIGSQQTTYKSYGLPTVTNVLRFAVYGLLLFTVAHYCERSYRQQDRIINLIDHTLINKESNGDSRHSLEQLRNVVAWNPLYFHAAHFYRLNYALLSSIASVVVTYTIILIQIQ